MRPAPRDHRQLIASSQPKILSTLAERHRLVLACEFHRFREMWEYIDLNSARGGISELFLDRISMPELHSHELAYNSRFRADAVEPSTLQ